MCIQTVRSANGSCRTDSDSRPAGWLSAGVLWAAECVRWRRPGDWRLPVWSWSATRYILLGVLTGSGSTIFLPCTSMSLCLGTAGRLWFPRRDGRDDSSHTGRRLSRLRGRGPRPSQAGVRCSRHRGILAGWFERPFGAPPSGASATSIGTLNARRPSGATELALRHPCCGPWLWLTRRVRPFLPLGDDAPADRPASLPLCSPHAPTGQRAPDLCSPSRRTLYPADPECARGSFLLLVNHWKDTEILEWNGRGFRAGLCGTGLCFLL